MDPEGDAQRVVAASNNTGGAGEEDSWIRRETHNESSLQVTTLVEPARKTCGSQENAVCGETREPGGSEFKAEALIPFGAVVLICLTVLYLVFICCLNLVSVFEIVG